MLNGSLVKTITSDGLEHTGFWMDQKSDTAVFHTHGTAGDFYTHKFVEVEGEQLASRKISFLTANNRGHDVYADIRKHNGEQIDWTQIGGAYEIFEESLLDIGVWVEFLSDRGVKKIILQGHSLGPNKNIYYQYKKQDLRILGFIHLSPQNDAGLMRHKFGQKKYDEVNKMIHKKLQEGKGREMLPDEYIEVCPISVQGYSGYFIEDGVGNLFPYHNPHNPNWNIVRSIKEPQLLIFGQKDPYITPSVPDAVTIFRSKAKNPSLLTSKIIDDASHSFVGYEKELVDEIIKWIKRGNLA